MLTLIGKFPRIAQISIIFSPAFFQLPITVKLITLMRRHPRGMLSPRISPFFKPFPVLSLFLVFSFHSRGQSGANSFPATGNASVGTTTSPNTFTINGTLTTNGTITQSGGTVSTTSGFSTYLLTDPVIPGAITNLNPGVCVYRDRWFDYGIDLGINSVNGRARTRIFCANTADVALSYINETGTVPTTQSQFTDGLVVLGGSGNVLIGQVTQVNSAYKLDVAGNVRANQITVNTTGADFVFDSTYTPLPLPALSAYIQANHHLPEMASAAQMQQEGVNLGDNQTHLLAKIEELTLYAIEEDRRSAALQKKIEQVEDRNKRLEARDRRLEELEKRMERLEHAIK